MFDAMPPLLLYGARARRALRGPPNAHCWRDVAVWRVVASTSGERGEGRQRGYQGREWRYAKDARGRKACIAPGRAGHRGLTGAAGAMGCRLRTSGVAVIGG